MSWSGGFTRLVEYGSAVHSTSDAERVVYLVNADLTTTQGLAAAMAHRPRLAERVTAADVGAPRSVRGELAALVDAPADGHGAVVVEVLNRVLARNPLRPTVSGGDGSRWNLHVEDEGVMLGLMPLVTEVGATWPGRGTGTRAYVDTSADSSRRFCRSRCSTQENVAALGHRCAAGGYR